MARRATILSEDLAAAVPLASGTVLIEEPGGVLRVVCELRGASAAELLRRARAGRHAPALVPDRRTEAF